MVRPFRKPRGVSPRAERDLFKTAFKGHWNEDDANQLREDVDRADSMGMRGNVFGKAGDSNLAAYNSLYGLGCRAPKWDRYGSLEETMLRYRAVELPAGDSPVGHAPDPADRSPWNSFSRSSSATRSGIVSDHLLMPSAKYSGPDTLESWVADKDCDPDRSMLDYEIGLLKPRYVFVNLGTNGDGFGMNPEETAKDAGRVVDEIRRLGPVPVVFTIPPQLNTEEKPGRWAFARDTSKWLRRIAAEAKVPMFDQWSVLADERLVNHGLIEYDGEYYDGFHLETPGGFRAPDALQQSVDFRPPALLYGAPLRNLLLLQTLAELDAAIGTDSVEKENLTVA
ncbi:MAG: SGNH/GDSL hydrolase family protein [Solirubrobacterales bacterium]|nr:SGNH/GDSL hydrolase family protein [Solirubrobacterales bacterium]